MSGSRGFGYQPERSGGYHFEVRPTAGGGGGITVVERFGAGMALDGQASSDEARERARLTAARWEAVQGAVAADFNQRLQGARLRPGRWLKGVTPLAPHFGKELVLLAWAIDDQDPTVIGRMLANWRGLAPEERWWFYTTINASPRSRTIPDGASHGWRAAIKVAFLDDPRDVGLESLRIAAEPSPVDEIPDQERLLRPVNSRRGRSPAQEPGAVQGRLFAEPDAPDYDAS
ncbi:MAG TPA: DUF3780 domain-containing protein [Thermomicrobiales bacterium]|jgi:hypothetical protein|nr:DUF3780 domain-containing protein [Thermomicrobiales bacterium]